MLLEVVKTGPLLICLCAALAKTFVGFAEPVLYLVDRLHVSISVITGCESFLVLRTVVKRAFVFTCMASRMFSVSALVILTSCSSNRLAHLLEVRPRLRRITAITTDEFTGPLFWLAC